MLPFQIPLPDKIKKLFQGRHQLLQKVTEMSDLDDFQQLMNNEKEQNAITIKESREKIRNKLQTLDDMLETFGEKQREFEESMRYWMRAMILGNVEANTNFKEAKKHQKAYENAILSLNDKKARVVQVEKDLQQKERYLQQQYQLLQQQVLVARKRLHKGLTDERILKFRKFEADDSKAGEKCAVCMDEFEVGRKLMQLDCKHEFCQDCVEGWLADHNTCPVCRKVFKNE